MYIVTQVKHPLLLPGINETDTFSENAQISNFTKIRPVRVELFRADGRTQRHDG